MTRLLVLHRPLPSSICVTNDCADLAQCHQTLRRCRSGESWTRSLCCRGCPPTAASATGTCFCASRPVGSRGKPTPPSRATAKAKKHRQNPWVALDRRAQPRVRLTPTLVSNEHKPRCLWMANWLPCAQQRARASDECLPDQRSTALGRKKS